MLQSPHRAPIWNQRRFFSVVAALLLLMMQQEANWHAVQHVGEWAKHARQQGLEVANASTYCVECALLAGGANIIAAAVVSPAVPQAATTPFTSVFSTRFIAAPSFYSGRGPPAFL